MFYSRCFLRKCLTFPRKTFSDNKKKKSSFKRTALQSSISTIIAMQQSISRRTTTTPFPTCVRITTKYVRTYQLDIPQLNRPTLKRDTSDVTRRGRGNRFLKLPCLTTLAVWLLNVPITHHYRHFSSTSSPSLSIRPRTRSK